MWYAVCKYCPPTLYTRPRIGFCLSRLRLFTPCIIQTRTVYSTGILLKYRIIYIQIYTHTHTYIGKMCCIRNDYKRIATSTTCVRRGFLWTSLIATTPSKTRSKILPGPRLELTCVHATKYYRRGNQSAVFLWSGESPVFRRCEVKTF